MIRILALKSKSLDSVDPDLELEIGLELELLGWEEGVWEGTLCGKTFWTTVQGHCLVIPWQYSAGYSHAVRGDLTERRRLMDQIVPEVTKIPDLR